MEYSSFVVPKGTKIAVYERQMLVVDDKPKPVNIFTASSDLSEQTHDLYSPTDNADFSELRICIKDAKAVVNGTEDWLWKILGAKNYDGIMILTPKGQLDVIAATKRFYALFCMYAPGVSIVLPPPKIPRVPANVHDPDAVTAMQKIMKAVEEEAKNKNWHRDQNENFPWRDKRPPWVNIPMKPDDPFEVAEWNSVGSSYSRRLIPPNASWSGHEEA